jgi:hypothetical protein
MTPETAIAGVGATPYHFRGQSAPQTVYELIGKAALAAVADAGPPARRIAAQPSLRAASRAELDDAAIGLAEPSWRGLKGGA